MATESDAVSQKYNFEIASTTVFFQNCSSKLSIHQKTFNLLWLVVSIPLKNMKVSWDDSSQYMEIQNSCSKPQPDSIHSLNCFVMSIPYIWPSIAPHSPLPAVLFSFSSRSPYPRPRDGSMDWRRLRLEILGGLGRTYHGSFLGIYPIYSVYSIDSIYCLTSMTSMTSIRWPANQRRLADHAGRSSGFNPFQGNCHGVMANSAADSSVKIVGYQMIPKMPWT